MNLNHKIQYSHINDGTLLGKKSLMRGYSAENKEDGLEEQPSR